MCIIDRRQFVSHSCAAIYALLHSPLAPAEEIEGGCTLALNRVLAGTSNGIGVVGKDVELGTGDPNKDKFLGRALARLAQTFDERPTFAFYDDGEHPNANASPGDDGVPGTWGKVRFGRQLFGDLTHNFGEDGIAILGVLAHEFAHVAQYRRKVMSALAGKTVKRSELHADLVSGYYLGLRKLANSKLKLRTAGMALYSIGDYAYNDPQHHGTPEERVAASEYGFSLANEGRAFRDVFDHGVDWVIDRYSA